MRAFAKLALIISRDLSQKVNIFDNRQDPALLDIDSTNGGPVAGDSKNIQLAAGGPSALYTKISFDGIAPSWLFVQTDNNITLRLNSADGLSGTEIPVQPINSIIPIVTPSTQVPPQLGYLFLKGALGAGFDLWVKNQAGTPTNVTVAFAG